MIERTRGECRLVAHCVHRKGVANGSMVCQGRKMDESNPIRNALTHRDAKIGERRRKEDER